MGQLKVDEHAKMPGVYVGDPCYILPEDFYDKFWGETHNYEDGAFTTEEGRPVMIVAATAYGDGCYPGEILNHATGERTEYNFGVDAGCLSIVNLEFADPKKIEEVRESSSLGIIIDQPCIGMQLNEDEGAFDIDVLIPAGPGERNSSHYVHIETAGYDDDEEEDDWDNWDDPYDEEMEELPEDEY